MDKPSRPRISTSFLLSIYLLLSVWYVLAHGSEGNGHTSTSKTEKVPGWNILVLYSLDIPEPAVEGDPGAESMTKTYASPQGPNPRYVAEIIAWELRQEGKVHVRDVEELDDAEEITHYDLVVIGTNSNDGAISVSTRSLFESILKPPSQQLRQRIEGKVFSSFVTSDIYGGCEEARDTMMKLLEELKIKSIPGLIITEDMDFSDAAQGIRAFAEKLEDTMKGKNSPSD